MIINQHIERLSLLRGFDQQLSLDDATCGVSPAAIKKLEVPITGEIHLFGNTPAALVLHDLGTSMEDLYQMVTKSGKPLLDVGASQSPFACEAYFFGIDAVTTDLRARGDNVRYENNILLALDQVRPIYQGSVVIPGFQVTPMSDKYWRQMRDAAIKARMAKHLTCSAKEILDSKGYSVADKAFSVVVSHNAVPMYSTFHRFVTEELPELLRVAEYQVRLYPFVVQNPQAKSLDALSYLSLNSAQSKQVCDLANRAGFQFEVIEKTETSPPAAFFYRG